MPLEEVWHCCALAVLLFIVWFSLLANHALFWISCRVRHGLGVREFNLRTGVLLGETLVPPWASPNVGAN